jgi:hypothetical protein
MVLSSSVFISSYGFLVLKFYTSLADSDDGGGGFVFFLSLVFLVVISLLMFLVVPIS